MYSKNRFFKYIYSLYLKPTVYVERMQGRTQKGDFRAAPPKPPKSKFKQHM
jgi:hypothetical protein